MKKNILVVGIASLLLLSSAAQANVGVSAEVGTTGAGVHLTMPVLDNLNARVGVNAFSYSYDGSTSDVDYNFKLKMQTLDVLADYHPFAGSGFRVSGGLIYNGNKIEANARPNANGTYTINGHTYAASTVGALNGKMDFRKIAPYLGIGWGNAVAKESKLSFTSDIGVMFQGSANASLTSSGCTASVASCTQLASDLATENNKLNDKLSKFNLYPVVRVGMGYKF